MNRLLLIILSIIPFSLIAQNVGIGEATPSTKLEIKGDGSDLLNVKDNSNDSKLFIDSDGNVGIGTSNPANLLDVNGSADFRGNLDMNGNQINKVNIITSENGANFPHIVLNSTGSGDEWDDQGAYISIGESGALGSASLHMTYRGDGYGFIGSGSVSNAEPSASYFRFDYNSSNIYTPDKLEVGSFKMSSGATDKFVLTTDGNGDATWEDPALLGSKDGVAGRGILIKGSEIDGPVNIASGISATGSGGSSSLLTDGAKAVNSSYYNFSSGSQGSGNENGYVQIDLGSAKPVSQHKLYFWNGDDRYYWFKLKYSYDGSTWYYAVGNEDTWATSAPSNTTSGINGEIGYVTDVRVPSINARYWRVYADGNTSNTSNHLYEWEILQEANPVSLEVDDNLNVGGRIKLGNDNDTEIYSDNDRVKFRAEGIDEVAEVSSYGMYLPRTGEDYNLYLGGKLKVGHDESGHIDINDGNTRILEGASNSIRHQTNSGYIDIGAQNSTWAHIYSDRSGFYFNQPVRAGSGNVHLNTSGNDSWISNGEFGIGTTSPTANLDVNGSVRIRGGSPTSGDVLTTDNSGNTSWEDPKNLLNDEYLNVYKNDANASLGWMRIARGSGRVSGEFTLKDKSCCGHSSLNFRAGASYNRTDGLSFSLEQHSRYSDVVFEKVRILTNSTYDEMYLEVYVYPRDGTGTQPVEYIIQDNETNNTWTPVDWTTGSVPSGYTSTEYNIEDRKFVVGGDGELFTITSSGNVGIGYSSPTYKLHVNGKIRSNGINETSDGRLKKNVKSVENALDKVMALRGVNYEWKINEFPENEFEEGIELGVIAQEVEQILPEVVDTDNEGYKSVQYSHIVPVLIEAIKEQQAIIEYQKNELSGLVTEISDLKEQQNCSNQNKVEINALKSEVDKLKSILTLEAQR